MTVFFANGECFIFSLFLLENERTLTAFAVSIVCEGKYCYRSHLVNCKDLREIIITICSFSPTEIENKIVIVCSKRKKFNKYILSFAHLRNFKNNSMIHFYMIALVIVRSYIWQISFSVRVTMKKKHRRQGGKNVAVKKKKRKNTIVKKKKTHRRQEKKNAPSPRRKIKTHRLRQEKKKECTAVNKIKSTVFKGKKKEKKNITIKKKKYLCQE